MLTVDLVAEEGISQLVRELNTSNYAAFKTCGRTLIFCVQRLKKKGTRRSLQVSYDNLEDFFAMENMRYRCGNMSLFRVVSYRFQVHVVVT